MAGIFRFLSYPLRRFGCRRQLFWTEGDDCPPLRLEAEILSGRYAEWVRR